jgi:hypothetical protein
MVWQHFLLKDFTKFRFKSGHNIESKYEERMKKKGRGGPGRAATQQLAADGQLDRATRREDA